MPHFKHSELGNAALCFDLCSGYINVYVKIVELNSQDFDLLYMKIIFSLEKKVISRFLV